MLRFKKNRLVKPDWWIELEPRLFGGFDADGAVRFLANSVKPRRNFKANPKEMYYDIYANPD